MAPHEDGLGRWIDDVVVLHAQARRALRVEVVHDLRVAIRRCRSLAQGLREIDDDVGARRWRTLSDAGRALFQGLGDLRDAQVMREHAAELLASDPQRDDVLAALDRRIAATKEGARLAVTTFDPAAWRSAALGLPDRAAALLGEQALFDHLGLRRFFEARELHQAAMRSKGATALHELRIGVKKLRYTVENFLPDAHASIGKILKRMQEVLGDLHDLDVLIAFIASEHIALHSNDRSRTASLVRAARDLKVLAYRQMTMARTTSQPQVDVDVVGAVSLIDVEPAWTRIRAAFASGDDVDRAHDALIARRVSTRTDRATTRTLERCATELLRAFRDDVKALAGSNVPLLVRRACRCAWVDGGGKAARKFVDGLPLAIGFSARDRALISAVVRAPTERAPALEDKRIAALPARDRPVAVAVGALLHLAAALVPVAPFVVRKGRDVVVIDAARPFAPTAESARNFAERRAPFEALLGAPLWSKAPPEETAQRGQPEQPQQPERVSPSKSRTKPAPPRPPAQKRRASRSPRPRSASGRPSA